MSLVAKVGGKKIREGLSLARAAFFSKVLKARPAAFYGVFP